MSTKIKTPTGWKTVANRTVCFGNSPVGAVQAYWGANDPEEGNWLICDGRDTTGTAIELATVYPKLYRFLGNSNVLPDLRGEFLRGAGTNSHSGEGNGASVGQHQDGSTIMPMVGNDSTNFASPPKNTNGFTNADAFLFEQMNSFTYPTDKNTYNNGIQIKIRPTNTSINWIICAR